MSKRHVLLPSLAVLLVLAGCQKPQSQPMPNTATQEELPPPAPLPAKKRVLDVPLWTQTLAVLDMRLTQLSPHGERDDLALSLLERVEAAFLATGRFEIVERARINAVKTELTDSTDAMWFDQTTVARMGRFLGAKYLALPTARLEVGVISSRLDLQVKVIDTESASTVQTFHVRTTSSSLSVNSSITSCLDRIRLELGESMAGVYPSQAMIIHSPKPGLFWAEAKQSRQSFKPGQKVRILEPREILNPIKGTVSVFLAEMGRGYVQSVEPFGIVVKAKGVNASEGSVVEAL